MANLNGSNAPYLDRYSNGCWVVRNIPAIPRKAGQGGKGKTSQALNTTNEKKARKNLAVWLKQNGLDVSLADTAIAISTEDQEAISEQRRAYQRAHHAKKKEGHNLPAVIAQRKPRETEEQAEKRRQYQRDLRARKKAEANGTSPVNDEVIEAAMGCLSAAMSSQAQAMKMLQLALRNRKD